METLDQEYKATVANMCVAIEMRLLEKHDAAEVLAVMWDIDVGKATHDIAKEQKDLTDEWRNSIGSRMYERKILKQPEVE